ncbi:hypothetical protein Tco_0066188 [Tanacetum coccineum]
MLVLWNNKEVDWQTKSEIKRDFPDFVTKVSFPKPPAAGYVFSNVFLRMVSTGAGFMLVLVHVSLGRDIIRL